MADPTTPDQPFSVYGLTVSYFTRKVTGYLDYAGIPWRLAPGIGLHLAAREAGWNGGIPVITTPDGELIWDSTAVILHLDAQVAPRHPERAILPEDPTLAFLVHVLEDFSDEWFYRPAVGTRWLWPENTVAGSWDIARDGAVELGVDAESVRAFVTEAMTGSLPRLGASAENIDGWIDDAVKPWLRAMADHVGDGGYLAGARPSLADFAAFGANVAHFVNDPACRRLTDEVAPRVVAHTHRLRAPWDHTYGDWLDPADLPDTFIALLTEAGRHYLPWVAEATVAGAAPVRFADGSGAEIATTNFLTTARGIMLARYREARSPELDAILDRAGILGHYADHLGQATEVPDPALLPRPVDNRPYPAGA